MTRSRATVGGAERVGHARDDLEAGPQAGGARAGERVAGRGRAPPARCRDRRPACAGSGAATRTRSGCVDDLQPGSSPTTASAPPVRGTPTKLPWRSESAARSSPGALPYHMAEHAVVLRAGQLAGELAAPRRRGAELLVQAGHVLDVVALDQLAVAGELLVEAAERRALVAGDHRAGHEPAAEVGAVLVERKPDEALEAGQEDAALLEDVLVVERDLAQRAAALLAALPAGGPCSPVTTRLGTAIDIPAVLFPPPAIGKRTLPLVADRSHCAKSRLQPIYRV